MRTFFRHIATLLCIMLLTLPLPAASPAAGKVIGVLLTSDLPRYREAHRHLLKVLSARGYTSSGEILLQIPNPDPQSWSNAIRKFVAYGADIIIAYGAPAVAEALKGGEGIPVVASDAVLAEGSQPRGLSGINARVPMVTLLRLLQEIRHPQKIGVLYNGREAGSMRQLEDLRKAARQQNLTLVEGNVASSAALDSTLNSLLDRSDALIVTESSMVCRQFERILARARTTRKPVLSSMPDAAERGALLSLEVSPAEQGEIAGQAAVKLLEGARPEQLGVASPRKIELVLNLKVARELDLAVPFQVLGMATRVLK